MGKLGGYVRRMLKYVIKGVPVVNVQASIVQLSPNEMLNGRVALITGGAQGIGYEIAKSFLCSGAKVIISGRNKEKLEQAIIKLAEETGNHNITLYVLDNTNIENIRDGVPLIVSLFGRIDILVNNAGILTYDSISTENEKQYDSVLNTNLKGPFFLAQQVGEYMIDNHIQGNILFVGSSSCLRPALSAYTLSKWGIRGMTLGLAKGLAPYGITVNGIAPGQTLTSMVPNHDDINNLYLKNVPIGRYILPEEIGNMAVILVSDMGRAIMGDMVYMTGGAGILTYEDITNKF